MFFSPGLRSLSLVAFACMILTSAVAHADTVTDVTIPYSTTGLYSGSWSAAINGAQIAAAPTSGNTKSGLTFGNWSGQFNEVTPGQTTSFNIGVSLSGSATVNTLINNFYGDNALDATVVFTNSLNQTATYSLFGGDTVRDYNQNTFQNTLLGGTPGVVTAQNWWNNGTAGQRLDAQTFYLPTSWNGTTLTSMSISNPSATGTDDALSALQVVNRTPSPVMAATPEPSSLALVFTGIAGMAGVLKRRFAR